jgi:endonuclease YncB( thermonuclease family)
MGVVWMEKDQCGRIVVDVWLGNRNINIEMVRDWIASYRQYAPRSRGLEQAEPEARVNGHGLWREKNPEPPWEFRKNKRDRAAEKVDSR